MTPPPSVGTSRPRGCTLRGVSQTYPRTCNANAGEWRPSATVRWSRLVIDDARPLLDAVCDAWPHWHTALAASGLLGRTSAPAISVEGDDELFLVFTARILEAQT